MSDGYQQSGEDIVSNITTAHASTESYSIANWTPA